MPKRRQTGSGSDGAPDWNEQIRATLASNPGIARLTLVRHSVSRIDPALSAHHWTLTQQGRCRCSKLATQLASGGDPTLFTSPEPKAVETARGIGRCLSISYQIVPGLQEHHRETVKVMRPARFEERVADLFRSPDRLVLGEETAREALSRFQQAVLTTLTHNPCDDPVFVSHGTVLTLFTAACTGMEPFPLWKKLTMPSILHFSTDLSLKDVILF